MTSDLVQRLRDGVEILRTTPEQALKWEASNRIEALEAEVAALKVGQYPQMEFRYCHLAGDPIYMPVDSAHCESCDCEPIPFADVISGLREQAWDEAIEAAMKTYRDGAGPNNWDWFTEADTAIRALRHSTGKPDGVE